MSARNLHSAFDVVRQAAVRGPNSWQLDAIRNDALPLL
jgi:hypothetical protein